jgi:DNA-binding CsgD family transcriptional regulator
VETEDAKKLSKRKLQILALLAIGKSSKEVGSILFISTDTVRTHRTHILKALGALNITHAVYIAIRLGLIKI